MLAVLIAPASFLLTGSARQQHARRAAVSMSEPNFYAVYHTFKPNTAEAWWTGLKDVDLSEMSKLQYESGIFNHLFLPSSAEGHILCLWECQDTELSPKQFQEFIDGPESPAGDALYNKVYKVSPGAVLPASAWPSMSTEAPTFIAQGPQAASEDATGHFFWVHHTFRRKKAKRFFEAMATLDYAAFEAANAAKGVKNHCFMPTGPADKDPVFCVWETDKAMTASEFAAFIDGPDGPSPGTFNNVVYPVIAGGVAPPTAFPGSVEGSWLDETVAKIEEMLPFKVADLAAKFEEAAKNIGA